MRIYEKTYTLSNLSPTITLDILDGQQMYYVRGTGTLTTGWSIGASDVPTRPTYFKIWYDGAATYSGGNAVTVLNRVLTQEQALSGKCIIEVNYNFIRADWDVAVLEGFDTDYEGLTVVPMNPAGATITLTSNSKQVQYFTSAAVPLTGNYSVTWSGTFRDGQTFFLKYAGLFTLGTSTLNIFGISIDAAQALLGDSTVIAWYDLANATFRTQLIGVPPSGGGGGTGAFATLPVTLTGVNYPAANAGDFFRITCAQEEGRLGTNLAVPPNPLLEPPNVRRVYQDDILYCLVTTAGGDTAAAGASFFVHSQPRAFVPTDSTAGTSNYRLNASGNYAAPNTAAVGATANLLIGTGNAAIGTSAKNLLLGFANQSNGTAENNALVGQSLSLSTGAEGNVGAGYFTTINGDHNVISGNSHVVNGDDNLVAGQSHTGTPHRSLVIGAGAEPNISNSLYIGATTSPASFGGFGGMQTQISALAGHVTAVTHPATTPLVLGTNDFTTSTDTLLLGSNSMAWAFEAHVIVAQTAVGADHANTSAVGDWAEYVVCGVAKRVGGVTTLTKTKWLDHRNRWIPSTSPNALAFRNRSVTGARPDMNLVQPSIAINANVVEISFVFPGFSSLMTDHGVLRTPQIAEYVAAADFGAGFPITIGTGAAGDGVIPNTITPAAAPFNTAVFRNPVVDFYDGSDADGTGFYGGSGFGATGSAITKFTSVAGIGWYFHGSYNNIVATVAFNGGDATGLCVMSAQSDHIGDNVGFTAGNYAGVANGNYAFTFAGGTGAGAAGYATIAGGIVTATKITDGGTGYTTGDVVTLTIPTALPVTVPAVFTPTLYWSIVSITIGGANSLYDNTTDLTLTFAGAGLSQAVGTAQITPTGIDGAGTLTVDTGGKNYGICDPTCAVFDGGGTLYEDGNGGSFRASGHIIISQLKYA